MRGILFSLIDNNFAPQLDQMTARQGKAMNLTVILQIC